MERKKERKIALRVLLLIVAIAMFAIPASAAKTLAVGQQGRYYITKNGSTTYVKKFTTSKKSVVSISKKSGMYTIVTAKKKGTATIKAKVGKKTKSMKIKVHKNSMTYSPRTMYACNYSEVEVYMTSASVNAAGTMTANLTILGKSGTWKISSLQWCPYIEENGSKYNLFNTNTFKTLNINRTIAPGQTINFTVTIPRSEFEYSDGFYQVPDLTKRDSGIFVYKISGSQVS